MQRGSRLHMAATIAATVLLVSVTVSSAVSAAAGLPPAHRCLSLDAPGASLAEAYRLQQQRNQQRLVADPVVGFKAGLTTVALQQRFGSDRPLFAALFRSGEQPPTNTIALAPFRQAKLETEIGILVAAPIRQPLTDRAALRQHFRELVPVIEIPDVGFVDGCQPNAVDLVAANVASASHLRGQPVAWSAIADVDAIAVTLQRDGAILASGSAQQVQQGIEATLLFLVNEALRHGYRIEPGQLFITGAMSGLVEARPGQHVADFGALGTIRFTVVP